MYLSSQTKVVFIIVLLLCFKREEFTLDLAAEWCECTTHVQYVPLSNSVCCTVIMHSTMLTKRSYGILLTQE
jgi:hypothetical protein